MPNPQIYTEALQLFKNTYKLENYDLKELQKSNLKSIYLNSAFNQSTTGDSPAAQFMGLASKTLSMYLETQTNLRADGKYLSSFNAKQFLADFEKLADAQYRSELEEGQKYNRKVYAGAKMEDLNKAFGKQINEMNKTLPTLWAEKLKKGTMMQNDLLFTTGNVMDNMENVIKSNGVPFEDQIINVVAAYETMKQVRESRNGFWGWLWKFIFRERNEIEETNFGIFESQVNRLRNEGYPVDKIAADLTGVTVLGREVKLEPVAEKLNEKLNAATKAALLNNTIPTLPAHKLGSMTVKFGVEMATQEVFKNLAQMNQEFDAKVAEGVSKKEAMKNYAFKVFAMAYEGAEAIGYENVNDTIIATQKIADAILKEVSPCSLDKTGLKEFTDGYALKHFDEMLEVVKPTVNAGVQAKLEGAFKEWKAEDVNKREIVFNDDNPFPENNVDKSAKIVEQPQINVPSLDK